MSRDSSLPPEEKTQILTPSLVLELREGKASAGKLLDDLYRDVLYRFCWGYLKNTAEAEDAVQDICFKVLRAHEVPENFRPWVYRIARNHCLNLLRNRGRRKDVHHLPSGSGLEVALTGQLTRLARVEAKDQIAELVDQLPENFQEVLRLRYVEDLSRSEIASVLDLPESVVKSRLFEGLKKLRLEASRLEFEAGQ